MRTPASIATIALFAACLAADASAQSEPPASTDPASTTGQTVVVDAAGNVTTVSSHLPDPPAHDRRAQFDAYDSDRDDAIDRREADADKYLARAFRTLDADGSGRLDFEEMRAFLED